MNIRPFGQKKTPKGVEYLVPSEHKKAMKRVESLLKARKITNRVFWVSWGVFFILVVPENALQMMGVLKQRAMDVSTGIILGSTVILATRGAISKVINSTLTKEDPWIFSEQAKKIN